ncbi:RidA family protein [bacterium M00.F.Ca.ET.228.01.1.1]|uniref:RidA family protein n=1 Tax=Paraburkholderia phenoliruptrix TaxID=252970 RepID=UPI001091C513|nr:RidA family protein [Paraburkholderia phenoliruptrix]TGP39741.1 RidA family protein [bacterium M00.F.Ca.ET.228.01.1.1]TGR95582.1 RidA family protein [bacterium M00.F.Ca.ET.191.01.1.1]TGT96570.1 RidA family protein [bacterium M00.F.Ca.ET.155.01.1.1]MBW0450971.1 RidA family protein [Paraburkholderia phenoliruptrix]MBW9095806.1 RidA family protein [Paraburkholderia phenoliruptrix]
MSETTSARLATLGLVLPEPIAPLGSYRTVSIIGNQAHVSGLGPFENGAPVTGVVGEDMSLERAQHCARLTMLMILACLDDHCGLDRVRRCARLTVYVRASASFTQHPKVANGASDLLLDLFGADLLPARSAIGVHTLPMGIPVEIDSVFELHGDAAR